MRHAKILMTQYFPMNWGIIATFATEKKQRIEINPKKS